MAAMPLPKYFLLAKMSDCDFSTNYIYSFASLSSLQVGFILIANHRIARFLTAFKSYNQF